MKTNFKIGETSSGVLIKIYNAKALAIKGHYKNSGKIYLFSE